LPARRDPFLVAFVEIELGLGHALPLCIASGQLSLIWFLSLDGRAG
jgi:hypothetical protein